MYRIISCKEYNAKREISDQWWIVQKEKTGWFGRVKWVTEKEGMWCSGGTFYVDLKFHTEKDAFDYIGRMNQGVPKQTVIEEPVCSYLGK